MLGKLKQHHHSNLDEPVEVIEAYGMAPRVQVLDVQRTYRPEDRQADHLRLIYKIGERSKDLVVSVSWETMAKMRSEMTRSGRELSDDDMLLLIVAPWALEQVEAHGGDGLPSGETLKLEFGDGPRPIELREMLSRYGFQPTAPRQPVTVDRPWVWEG